MSAEIVSTWEIIPNILTIAIGSASSPGMLSLRSDGRFSLKGASSFRLFIGAVFFGGGQLEVSETHCFLNNGTFYHQVQNLYSLHLRTVQGRIESDRHFEFAGSGNLDLSMLGLSLKNVQGKIDDQQVAIAANLDADSYSLYGIPFSCPSMIWRGTINLKNPQQPELELQGSGSMQIFNSIQIDGTLTINVRQGIPTVSMSGRLLWQGQEWLNAKLEFRNQSLTIEGQTSFDFNLQSSQLAASLYVRVDLQGEFGLNTNGAIVSLNIRGSVLVGLKSSSTDQVFPIAASSIGRFSLSTGLTDKLKLVKLVSVRRFGPIQWNQLGFDLPIPEDIKFSFSDQTFPIPKFRLDPGSLDSAPRLAFRPQTIYSKYQVTGGPSISITQNKSYNAPNITFRTPGRLTWSGGNVPPKPRFHELDLKKTCEEIIKSFGGIQLPNLEWENKVDENNLNKDQLTIYTDYSALVNWQEVKVQGTSPIMEIPTYLRLLDRGGNDLSADPSKWRIPKLIPDTPEQGSIPIPSKAHLVWGKNKLTTLPILQVPSFDLYLIWNETKKRFDVEVDWDS
ncbi:MAG: hypothetical protein HC849_06020 [Oscillatoriales cyanobacterium RU_3_3]|nr:hypothetical protein [Oscillatoriales cyanobacterium RU_3_3]